MLDSSIEVNRIVFTNLSTPYYQLNIISSKPDLYPTKLFIYFESHITPSYDAHYTKIYYGVIYCAFLVFLCVGCLRGRGVFRDGLRVRRLGRYTTFSNWWDSTRLAYIRNLLKYYSEH